MRYLAVRAPVSPEITSSFVSLLLEYTAGDVETLPYADVSAEPCETDTPSEYLEVHARRPHELRCWRLAEFSTAKIREHFLGSFVQQAVKLRLCAETFNPIARL